MKALHRLLSCKLHSNRLNSMPYFVCAALLSGCQSYVPEPTIQSVSQRIQHADQLTQFTATGRIAVLTEDRRQSIRFVYQQLGTDFKLNLVTLLGVSVGSIRWQSNQLETRFNGETLTGDAAWQQAYSFLPLNFDLSQLGNYLTANIKDNGMVVRDSDSNVSQLRPGCTGCQNILVSYSDYVAFDGIQLPSTIIVTDLANQYSTRMKVHEWER